jgi:SAM-dependent methyltransferase
MTCLMRPYLLRALAWLRVLKPLWLLKRGWRLRRLPIEAPSAAGGLPVPPLRLRLTTCDSGDVETFLNGGANVAASISIRLSGLGREIESLSAILEFGCGCGRVARHWAHLAGPEIHGCDANRELVAWCAANLPFLRAAENELRPPLPYENEKFDLVYAISVLTHLPPALQWEWAAELRRVLRPGGLLIATFHGDRHAERLLLPRELRRYRASGHVGLFDQLAGSNRCATFNSRADVEGRILDDFEIVEFSPSRAAPGQFQDLYVGQLTSG